jgi:hypothetical protein
MHQNMPTCSNARAGTSLAIWQSYHVQKQSFVSCVCMYICACVYVYMHVCVCVYIYIYIYIYAHTHIVFMYLCGLCVMAHTHEMCQEEYLARDELHPSFFN